VSVNIEDLALIGDKLTEDFQFYKNQKIFLTGGTGFFGKWLLEAFIYLNEVPELNISVMILSRTPEKFTFEYPHFSKHKNFSFVQGDVRTFSTSSEEFDLIIHAATDASVELNKSNPELMRNTIIDGAKRICDFADRVNCKRILYTSSGAAYGLQPKSMSHISEGFIDNPDFNSNDAYATAKLESETYFKDNAPCDVVIARCFAFVGPYLPLNGSFAIGNFISDVLGGRDIKIIGDGTAIRSYLYAADLVIWLLRLLSSGKNGEIYNVGSSQSISIKELANKISLSKVKVYVLGENNINTNIYVPCINKAKKELGLDIYTPLSLTISKTINFFEDKLKC